MTEFRFPPVLSIAAWEAEIDAPSGAPAGDRPGGQVRGGPHLDFGRVEYVELGVLARALLVLDAAVAAGVGATVTLPAHELEQEATRGPGQLADPDGAESDGVSAGAAGIGDTGGTSSNGARPDGAGPDGARSDTTRPDGSDSWSRARQTRQRAGRRGQVRAFMRQAGFQEAPHWPADAVRLRGAGAAGKGEDVDELPSGDVAAGRDEPAVEPLGYRRRLLPLQWLQPMEGAGLREPARYVSLEQGLGDLGLPASDARAIGETVLAELIDNAARLAASHDPGNPRVLVGGQLLDRDNPPALDRPSDAATTGGPGAGPDESGGRVLRLFAGGAGRPDTVFEATVPVGPRFSTPSGHWSAHPALSRPHRLGWIGATLDPEHGLGAADRAAFASAVAAAAAGASRSRGGAAVSGTRTCGVVVTVSTGGDTVTNLLGSNASGPHDLGPQGLGTLRQAVRRTLAALAAGTERAAVAAVFPDLTRQILESCVIAGLEVDLPAPGGGRGAKQTGRPMLVLGAQGRSLWYGGSAPMRAVLDLLTRAGGVVPLAQARQCWLAARGDKGWLAAAGAGDEFDKTLRNNRQLCAIEGENLVLLLSPLHVLSALTDAAQRELTAKVLRGGSGVRSGLFRTPTMALTNRWIDVGQLLDGTIGFDMAAFALARAVQAELATLPPSRAPVVVAQTHTCPPRLAGQLSECLALGDRTYPAGSELDLGGWPTAGDVPCDSRVVLCADAILTENTVRRVIADIVECAEPVVIACVVDARAKRGRIKVLNREIPVVALAEIDLMADEGAAAAPPRETRSLNSSVGLNGTSGLSVLNNAIQNRRAQILDIDPLSLRPLPPRTPERLPISEEELLYWCAPHAGSPSGALRLGHIEYARRVHVSAAADVDRLFRNEKARARVTEVLLDTIQRGLARVHHHADPSRPEDAIQLWHPGRAQENAGRIAHAAWSLLAAAGHQVSPPLAFERLGAGSSWLAAPAALDRALRPRTVLILDYVTRTGSTLQQMIRYAVSAGAERIVAVVALDQLPDHDRGLLGSISSVSAEAVGARTMRGSEVPVVVRYISTTSIGGDEPHSCAMCATREKYADFAEAPERLRHHAGRLRDLLRPRRRDEVFESGSADLFGVPLLGDDAADYLRWRGLLRRALYETSARQEVMERLAAMQEMAPDSAWGPHGLTRLLAAEHSWLRLPPLRYAAARDLVARYCIDQLGSAAPEPPWLRAQTVMVLAAAAPRRFVATLPTLVELGADEPVVVDQLCLEAYRLARKPRHDSPIDLAELHDALLRCRDQLEGSRAGWDHRLVEDYAHVVRQLVFLAGLPPRPQLDDPREAWARLAEQWCGPIERHRFESKLLRVRDFVEDLQAGAPSRERTAAAEADLRECARLVEERVLAYLARLRDILAGEYAAELFGRADQERLVAMAGISSAGLLELSERLSALLREPRSPDSMQWRAIRRELLDRISWWYNALFATHRPITGAAALLVDLVRSAPTPVAEVVKAAVAARGLEGSTQLVGDLDHAQVFCPRDLLYRAIGHVLDDALDRFADTGSADSADLRAYGADRELRIEIGLRRPGPDAVQLVVRDTAVLPGPADPGRCLGSLARGLKPFGGWVTGRALAAEGWRFESVIALRPWQGV